MESRRRCVRNSQLVGDSFDEFEQICEQQVELRRVGAVNAHVGSRRELVENFVHTADETQLATRQLRRISVGGVYWALHAVNKFDAYVTLFEITDSASTFVSTILFRS